MPAAAKATRSSAAAKLRALTTNLPDDLVLEILARLEPCDLANALSACQDFARLAPWAWRALCFARWPAAAAVSAAAGPISDWRRQAEFYALRDREEEVASALGRGRPMPTAGAPASPPVPQPVVGPRHRAILVEWLAEVSFEWGTESTVVFKAAAYLDAYLAAVTVDDLSQFQLLGIAALRAAMADAAARSAAAAAAPAPAPAGPSPAGSADTDAASTSAAADTAASAPSRKRGRGGRAAPPTARPAPSGLEEERSKEAKPEASTAAGPAREGGGGAAPAAAPAPSSSAPADPLDPARFSHIAARTYTPAAVEAATAAVAAAAPPCLASAPNAKMFLRAFWYRALGSGGTGTAPAPAPAIRGGPDAMHVYTLASFFLSLALLDASWAGTPASLAAGGALSLALEVCGAADGDDAGGDDARLWPAPLQAASGHPPSAIAAQRSALRSIQSSTAAPHLRRVWAAHHAGHGYAEFKDEWDVVLAVMADAGQV